MSITSAFASALSGIAATARQAEILSSNVANATTPGYARREVALAAHSLGGTGQGVRIKGVTRDTDLFLINDRRAAEAEAGGADTRATFMARLEGIYGDTESTGSLVSRVNALDTALLQAASHPESEARLSAAVDAAKALATGLNQASDAIQEARSDADRTIAAQVDTLNAALREVRDLNAHITAFTGAGRDVSALLDQRAQVIDSIARIIPLREVPRDGDQVALFSTGGAVLLDGQESEFGYSPVTTIVPEMTQASGGLSGLTLNGKPMATSGPTSLVLGGDLAGQFAVRDELAVAGQAGLDALARDLVERFSAAGLDTTLASGAPGLFTDGGTAFATADEVGLAARIALNAAVDVSAGGSVLRLRDGLAATTTGPSGNAALLTALSDALTAARPTASSSVVAGSRSAAALATDILSMVSTDRLVAESEQSFSNVRMTSLQDLEAEGGVDVDAEMQALLVIEKNYAANAKVIQALDEMLNTLLGL